jgi:hypothetical protein
MSEETQAERIIFVKLTAKEDGQPLWINLGVVLGLRTLPEGGTCVLTHNGALHVLESLDVLFSLPPVQCWQVPELSPPVAEEAKPE